ncbi:Leupeptin-inactivating enzyme 2 [Nonomuraea sp. NN258]|uniref:M4 family metallopeptidase n=1 Tax=Nonomuraea antri TaxID=2730852 RepID=UPI001C2C8CC2|nr:M4 family metallopeptidase [Nonomuraea antri]NRQ35235.1 Leupeptin-inactivating enzyme 2 [Nonomuraea antri]
MLALALTTSSLAGATSAFAGASQVADPPSPTERVNAITSAKSALLADSAALRASDKDSFTLESAVTGTRGLQYLSYARTYAGLPVYGGGVVVATDESGAVVNTVASGQQTKINVSTTPKVAAEAAAVTARTKVAEVESVATPVLSVHATTTKPRLAWEVVVTGVNAEKFPTTQHVYVDAQNGRIIDAWDEVRAASGHGYYNGQVTIDTAATSMTDPTRSGISCGGQNGSAYTGTDSNWGNGQGTNLETACVDALYGAQKQWDMLRSWLNRNGINGSGRGYPSRVGLAQVNAFWNGQYANFGRSQDGQRQVTPMDVVAHEFGHGIFQFTPGGSGSGNEAGGLNESTGDIFGALTEAYAQNASDPADYLVGEEVNLVGSGPIRNMYNPAALSHPNCYTSAIPRTEVHAAAGPQNHWFYLLAEGSNPGGGKPSSPICTGGPASVTGIGIQKAGQIFMGTLNLKTQPWTHARARVASLNAAKSLFPGSCTEFNTVKAAWLAVQVPQQSGEPTCTQGDDAFSMELAPPSGSVTPGQSSTTTVRTTVTSGSAQSITLRVGSLPAGVNASFNPQTITAGQTSTLTVTTSANSPQGTHSITVTADGTAVDRTANYTLQIGPGSENDFSVSVSPTSASVEAGQSATTVLSTVVTSGQAQNVALTAANVPAGVSVSFNPQTISSGQSSTVTISTTGDVTPNTYAITLNADGASADHSASFSLTVSGDGGETTWATWTPYTAGQTVTYQGVSYRCLQSHTSLPGWEPPNVPALWQRV